MVMESPSPQCVGREFVRQYYTLMNEAPSYLHRFYSTSSSFVHSGSDSPGQESLPVYGQKEIHKKITELNFEDCHTKIRQVDSQATVGQGVVVQVTGELSNQGGPMRRFMQTFVLAPQNPKQYYVHNDIFRYQDEVFLDSYESEEEADKHTALSAEGPVENGTTLDVEDNAYGNQENADSPSHAVNHCATPERVPTPTRQDPADDQAVEPASAPQMLPDTTSQTPSPGKKVSSEASPEPQIQQKASTESKTAEPDQEILPASSEVNANNDKQPTTFSWANVVNKSAGGSSAAIAVVPPMNTSSNKQAALPLSVITSQQKEESLSAAHEEQSMSQKSTRPTAEPSSGSRPPVSRSGADNRDLRTNERFPDNQQVFVGNLPHDVAELKLKRFFQNYGKVLDIRINRGGGNGKVPFGFVVFDNTEPVQELLKLQRVEMNGHRLNVEEKKARSERAGSSSRVSRVQRPPQRAGSRPKDREDSGSRSDMKSTHNNKFRRP